jgi:hypothetical protein
VRGRVSPPLKGIFDAGPLKNTLKGDPADKKEWIYFPPPGPIGPPAKDQKRTTGREAGANPGLQVLDGFFPGFEALALLPEIQDLGRCCQGPVERQGSCPVAGAGSPRDARGRMMQTIPRIPGENRGFPGQDVRS